MKKHKFDELEVFARVELAFATTDKSILNSAKLDSHDLVREAYASNPNLSSDKLNECANSLDFALVLGLVKNENASEQQLADAASCECGLVLNTLKQRLAKVKASLNLDANAYLRIAGNLNFNSPEFKIVIASPDITEDTLLFILDAQFPKMTPSVRYNPTRTLAVGDYECGMALVHPNATEKVLLRAFDLLGVDEQQKTDEFLPYNYKSLGIIPESKLVIIERFLEGTIVGAVRNKNCTKKVLDLAINSVHNRVIKEAYLNPKLDQALIDDAINYSKNISYVLANPSLSLEQLESIFTKVTDISYTNDYRNSFKEDLVEICSHKSADDLLLTKCRNLLKDSEACLVAVAGNPSSSETMLNSIARLVVPPIRDKENLFFIPLVTEITKNPNTTEAIVITLLDYIDLNVEALTLMLACPVIGIKFFTRLEQLSVKDPMLCWTEIFSSKFTPEKVLLRLLVSANQSQCLFAINNKLSTDLIVDTALARFKISGEYYELKNKIVDQQQQVSIAPMSMTMAGVTSFKRIADAILNKSKEYYEGIAENLKTSESQFLEILSGKASDTIFNKVSSNKSATAKILLEIVSSKCNATYKVRCLEHKNISNDVIMSGLNPKQKLKVRVSAVRATSTKKCLIFALNDIDSTVVSIAIEKLKLDNKMIFDLLKTINNPVFLILIFKFKGIDILNSAICAKSNLKEINAEATIRGLI